MKNFYSTNDIIMKVTRQATDWEEILTKHVLQKTHISRRKHPIIHGQWKRRRAGLPMFIVCGDKTVLKINGGGDSCKIL